MKKILKKPLWLTVITTLCLVVASLFSAYSCNKTENTLPNYPVKIPFTEYSLAGTFCQWTNLNYDDKIIVINSNKKLASYINCLEGNYPEIDFSKHTLLLASGTTPNGIVEISNRLLQLSANEYKLDIKILLNEAEVIGKWITVLIVNKLNEESDIELVTILRH